jgi:hypothetical protein
MPGDGNRARELRTGPKMQLHSCLGGVLTALGGMIRNPAAKHEYVPLPEPTSRQGGQKQRQGLAQTCLSFA